LNKIQQQNRISNFGPFGLIAHFELANTFAERKFGRGWKRLRTAGF